MKSHQEKSPPLTLIIGGRQHLEKRLKDEVAEGRLHSDALDSLKPCGQLSLIEPQTDKVAAEKELPAKKQKGN